MSSTVAGTADQLASSGLQRRPRR